jgi:type IV pilus assembly protein PilZ
MDTRVYPRIPVHLEVSYRDGEDLASSYVESLSGGGVFIRTSRPLPIGTEILMEIRLEDASQPPIRVRGKVVWERLVGRADGMGVQFVEEPPENLRKLLTRKSA